MWNTIQGREVLDYAERNQSIYTRILDNIHEENRYHRNVNHSTRAMYRTIVNSTTNTERIMISRYVNRRTTRWGSAINLEQMFNTELHHTLDFESNVTFYTWPNYDNIEVDASGVERPIEFCPITYERFSEGDRLGRINRCGHLFSETALRQWLRQHNTCPICRAVVDEHYSPIQIRGTRIPNT